MPKILGLVLLLALIIGVVVIWRRARRKQGEQFIDAYPYQRFLDERLAEKRPELTPAQRQMVFDGLKEYFHLCNLAGRSMVAMPSQVVDDAWHEFILSTRQYKRFCDQALGRFLHHTPAEAMRSPTEAQEGIKRAWRLACAAMASTPERHRACRSSLRSTACSVSPTAFDTSSTAWPQAMPARATVPATSDAAAAAPAIRAVETAMAVVVAAEAVATEVLQPHRRVAQSPLRLNQASMRCQPSSASAGR